MGGVVQQINLYRGNEAARTAHAGARSLLLAGVAALLVVVVGAISGEVYLSGLAADRQGVAVRLQGRETELAKFRVAMASPAIDPHLEAELSRLREAKAALDANLTAIAQHAGAARKGFSAFFGGLARNTLEGLWLNNVGVSAGGADMLLKGQTTEPALVPRLLQTLAAEPAFNGRTFRKVSFERQDSGDGRVVDFELHSASSAETHDAG